MSMPHATIRKVLFAFWALALANAADADGISRAPSQAPQQIRAEFEKRFIEEWGRLPEPGELFDARRPLAISLSPDGKCLAIDMFSPNCEWVEVWNVETGVKYACPSHWFAVDAHRGMKWHPTRKLIAVTTDTNGFWLLNVHTGKASNIIGAYPGSITWAGNGDQLLIDLKGAGEKPSRWSLVNIWNGKSTPCREPCFETNEFGALHDLATSTSGDIAAEVGLTEGPYAGHGEIIIFHKQAPKRAWQQTGAIHPMTDSAGKVIACPKLVNWLFDGRLVYAMIYTQGAKPVALWRCRADGSSASQWLELPDAQPRPGYAITQWLTVSGNGKRVAFLREDKIFVFDASEM